MDPAQLRELQRTQWDGVAGAWGDLAGEVDAQVAPVTARLLELTAPSAGDTVLEIACGPGTLGVEAARVAGGPLVLSDLSPAMLGVAAGLAARAGLEDVSTLESDLQDLQAPDGSADVVLCRMGLMFAAHPDVAVAEIARVLAPGGRCGIAVWGPREENPWVGSLMDAVSEQFGRPIPPPGMPGPFSLADPERLAGLLAGAGLGDVHVERVPVARRAADFDSWWARVPSLAGPLAGVLAAQDDATRAAIREKARVRVEPHRTPAGLELPGVALVGAARRV